MEIIGDKIILKSYTLERCHEFYRSYISDPSMTYSNYIYIEEKVNEYFRSKVLDQSRHFFAICINESVIGEIQLKRINLEKRHGTLSIHLINDKYKGYGYGTEAEKLMIEFAGNELGLQTIYADTVHRNDRSKHILLKLGFEYLYDDEVLSYFKIDLTTTNRH